MKFSASAALVLFVVTLVSSWRCDHPCGDAPIRKTAACHGDTASAVKIADGHDCSSHAADAAPATRETRYELRITAITSAFEISTTAPSIVTAPETEFLSDPDPPQITRPTPLRI